MSDSSHQLNRVECYVGGVSDGLQNGGFTHNPGSAVWGYASCCFFIQRSTGSGAVQTEDVAYRTGDADPIASGFKNWTP